jgi:hypothetical protein
VEPGVGLVAFSEQEIGAAAPAITGSKIRTSNNVLAAPSIQSNRRNGTTFQLLGAV